MDGIYAFSNYNGCNCNDCTPSGKALSEYVSGVYIILMLSLGPRCTQKTLTAQMFPIKVQVNHKCRRILAQWIHNNQTILLMTLNNETPSFYNKANPKSMNGESHCFNVSVETKVPPCAS